MLPLHGRRRGGALRQDGANGIEYGDMQLICEAYAILRDVLGLDADELHERVQHLERWRSGQFPDRDNSQHLPSKKDPETGKPLVDLILDKAGQKGTGKWTIQVGHRTRRGDIDH